MDWWTWLAGATAGSTATAYCYGYVVPWLHARKVRRNGVFWACDECPFTFTMLPTTGGPTAAHVDALDRVITAHRQAHT